MSEVANLAYDVLRKPPTTPYDDLKFDVLKLMEEPKLKFTKRLRKELMNGVAREAQS
ncbi:unnamed protein product [Hymenolepis diminuta]|uniref:Uncharacterized protein n=1 Tax=Hymenolepis diminuta TaxID=6216 RepID=A0A564XXV9_HYMDI|nr:unnamed protein product [Hymenolepis diminuta]